MPVRAPRACSVERVRASGVGYGRSLYLHADDGSLIVFGHLDAYAPAVAAWVDSVQRATGEYEQDLWPAAGRMRFAQGDTVAWTGESGAGGPHLHMEIRHGDFALNPLRAGIVQPGDTPPRLETLTLEPLDEASFVSRCAAPRTIRLGVAAETLVVEGRVRAVVRSRAGLPAASDVPAWSTSAQWQGERIEARLDSISWAGEMSEQDLVLDRGRVNGSGGWILQHSAEFTPRFLGAPGAPWEGIIEVHPGDSARPLLLAARDAQGLEVERTVWLRGPGAAERGVDSLRIGGATRGAQARWAFASLPSGRLRVRLTGTPAGLHEVHFGAGGAGAAIAPAGWDGAGWSAVLAPAALPSRDGFTATGRLPDGRTWQESLAASLWSTLSGRPVQPPEFGRVTIAPDAVYEQGTIVARVAPPPATPSELVPCSQAIEVSPERWPLRHAVPIALSFPGNAAPDHVDLYRCDAAGDWTALRARWDAAARGFRAETSAFGTFALLRDLRPPGVTLLPPARRVPAGPYARWQLEARVSESGSGVDAAASAFTIDGVRVPSEWDGEAHVLRWRPLRAPLAGAHRVAIRVVDRAGNATGRKGRFVLDSAGR